MRPIASACALRLAVLLLFIAGCHEPTSETGATPDQPSSRDPSRPPDPILPSGRGPFSDRLVVIDPASLILVGTPDEQATGTYRFRLNREPERLAAVGDVIYGREGNGFLQRVIGITRKPQEIAYTTTRAFPHEVVIGGTYRASAPLPNLGSSPGLAPAVGGPAASIALPAGSVRLDSLNLCVLADSILAKPLCGGGEKTLIDKGVVELNGRLDSLLLVSGSVSVDGDMDASITIDPGGDLIPNTGRRPVFSPCDVYPNVTGCFAKVGSALQSFLTSVGIDPGVLPPLRMCIPGTPIVIKAGSVFPFRLPTVRICKITDWGALPDFTPPGLEAATIVLHPHLKADLTLDVAMTGTLKLTLPVPKLTVTKCFDHGNGFFCLKLGLYVVVQTRAVEAGGQLQLAHDEVEKITLTWTPATEWVHDFENESRNFQLNVVPNNPPDTLSFRFGPAFIVAAELCFGGNASGCKDQGDNTSTGGGLIDLQLGVKGKASLGHFIDAVWSRDQTFDNWHIDIDGLNELEFEAGLILPRFLFRLDKNLKRSWPFQCCRLEAEDLHGTGVVLAATATTGALPDPDGYTVTIARADTLPGIGEPGAQRLTPPNWADTLSRAMGVNETFEFNPSPYCVILFSDALFTAAPSVPGALLPLARRKGLGVPNYSAEMGCQLMIADYVVSLTGVADNCQVLPAPSQTIRLSQLRLAPVLVARARLVKFDVNCPAPAVPPGTLEVSVTSGGFSNDPDGYRVLLDGMDQGAVPTNGSVTLSGVVAKTGRSVGLGGLASNCAVVGGNPVTIDVLSGATASVAFEVTCGPIAVPEVAPANLRVTTATTGSDPDPDGYSLSLNGVAQGPIGSNAQVLLQGLSPGNTDVVLEGVASNCQVQNGTVAEVQLVGGATLPLSFAITCSATAAGPPTGSVQVAVRTRGQDQDPDGYRLRVGAGDELIGPNETRTVSGLAVGSASVSLEGVAPNCLVQGNLPLTVPVSENGTTDLEIVVECQAYARIEVTTARKGELVDADGYRVLVDGGDRGALPVVGMTILEEIVAGEHSVALDGVAPHCRFHRPDGTGPANPLVVEADPGETVAVSYVVSCLPPGELATLVVRVSEPAGAVPGSYPVFLNGVSRGEVTAAAELVLPNLYPSAHAIQLDGLSAGCRFRSANPRLVTLGRRSTVYLRYEVQCGP
jgi:hypothetical protein